MPLAPNCALPVSFPRPQDAFSTLTLKYTGSKSDPFRKPSANPFCLCEKSPRFNALSTCCRRLSCHRMISIERRWIFLAACTRKAFRRQFLPVAIRDWQRARRSIGAAQTVAVCSFRDIKKHSGTSPPSDSLYKSPAWTLILLLMLLVMTHLFGVPRSCYL